MFLPAGQLSARSDELLLAAAATAVATGDFFSYENISSSSSSLLIHVIRYMDYGVKT